MLSRFQASVRACYAAHFTFRYKLLSSVLFAYSIAIRE
jgi:hypothetical protein